MWVLCSVSRAQSQVSPVPGAGKAWVSLSQKWLIWYPYTFLNRDSSSPWVRPCGHFCCTPESRRDLWDVSFWVFRGTYSRGHIWAQKGQMCRSYIEICPKEWNLHLELQHHQQDAQCTELWERERSGARPCVQMWLVFESDEVIIHIFCPF